MSDSNRISSADSFLEELEASAELPGRHCGLEHLLIQQVGNNTEFIVREIDSTSTACLKSDFPLNVMPLSVEPVFDPAAELQHFLSLLKIEESLLSPADRIGQISVDIGAQPKDFALSKLSRDLDLIFDYSSGKVIGVKEVDIDVTSADGSSSMQREVGSSKDFVRGSSSNAPFLPGGVHKRDPTLSQRAQIKRTQKDIAAYSNIETSPLFDFSTTPPILPKFGIGVIYDSINGANLIHADDIQSERTATRTLHIEDEDLFAGLPEQVIKHAEERPSRDESFFRQLKRERYDEQAVRMATLSAMRDVVKESGDAVPTATTGSAKDHTTRSPLDLSSQSHLSSENTFAWLRAAQRSGPAPNALLSEWAVTERMTNIMTDFDELVPDPAIIYPFEMDDFQKEAAYHLEQGESVFIAAHTSAGKTVVAEYAIALAMKHMTRAIYTSPIKALSNQKYRDFKDTFGDDVGLITGDVSVHSDATCLIVTTEILRSMLYKGADLIRDVEWVIFDEVHYINDSERGVVWEEVIIMLPEHVGLIFLSATVPNTLEFADWVGRTKRKKVFVIKTDKRPVPLEHYLYYDKNLYKMCDAKEGYLTGGHAAVTAAIRDKVAKKEAAKPKRAGASSAMRFKPLSFSSQRGEWSKIVQMLHAKSLLPAVCFVFSKNKCMDLAQSLVHVDLTNKSEKWEIKKFINESIKRLKGTDRQLPQVLIMSELLSRGIGVHHSGLLPIVKEIVEILFSTGLIKVLFATETFAMGVNMPTRTVVFNSTRKFDGGGSRDLLPGEYIQMSGRAGRRGLDTVGTVIVVVFDEVPESVGLRTMVTGRATKLSSQFRLTYNMILNLLKMGGDFKIEDMIKRSFFESSNQKDTTQLKEKLKLAKAQVRDIEEVVCLKPDFANTSPSPMATYHELVKEERNLMRRMHQWLVRSAYMGELLCSGRVLVVSITGLPKQSLAVVIRTPGSVSVPKNLDNPDAKATMMRILVLTGSSGSLLTDKYKLVVVDSISPQIEIITVKKLKKVEAERVDLVPDDHHISQLIKELDDIRIEALPGLPAVFDPIKNLKVKDLDFVDMNRELRTVRDIITTSPCHECEYRTVHLAQQDRNSNLRDKVSAIEYLLSDQNLLMIPEYEARVAVLKQLGFVNQDGIVQIKGRVARELNNCDELIATELIFQNMFTDMPSDEIVALLSCFVFQDKSDSEPQIPPALKGSAKFLTDLATRLGELQVDLGVPITPQDFVQENINPGLMEVIYEWAHSRPFHEIVRLTDVQEGSIVRSIVRLDETLRDFRSAAKLIGNVDLALKMEEASHLIKRDIVFASSLYIADAPKNKQQSDGSALAE